MKKDNRIYRPEQLTEEQKNQFFDGLDKFLDQKWTDEEQRRSEAEAKRTEEIASGIITVINGRQFITEFLNVNSILTAYNMNMKQLSDRFGIPYRTVQNWCADGNNKRTCPDYVLKMMIEILERGA